MNKKLEENNYIVVNFISSEEASNYYKIFKDYYNQLPNKFTKDDQCPLSPSVYNYKPFLELLVNKLPYMNDVMNEQMLPTYSYARIYKNGEVLEPHTDRDACEISITLHLGGDKEWPIWFTDPQGNKVSVNLKIGQAAIYKGIVSKHWRETFEGDEYAQVFLHYVRSNSDNSIHYFDR
jgi:hypothetical protein